MAAWRVNLDDLKDGLEPTRPPEPDESDGKH